MSLLVHSTPSPLAPFDPIYKMPREPTPSQEQLPSAASISNAITSTTAEAPTATTPGATTPHRSTLRGIAIPAAPPPRAAWRFPDAVKAALPSYFCNALDSVENAGREFSFYCERYQDARHDAGYATMTALLASWEIVAQNVEALGEGVAELREHERAAAGGESGVGAIKDAIAQRAEFVEPYRLAMSVLAEQGVRHGQEEDEARP